MNFPSRTTESCGDVNFPSRTPEGCGDVNFPSRTTESSGDMNFPSRTPFDCRREKNVKRGNSNKNYTEFEKALARFLVETFEKEKTERKNNNSGGKKTSRSEDDPFCNEKRFIFYF